MWSWRRSQLRYDFAIWRADVLKFGWRVVMTILLLAAAGCLIASFGWPASRGKWINSAGLLFDVSGVIQLQISGLFDKILETYGDEEKYPYGPPSHITRQIVSDPDRWIVMWLRDTLFFDSNVGFYFLLVGFGLQLAGTWL